MVTPVDSLGRRSLIASDNASGSLQWHNSLSIATFRHCSGRRLLNGDGLRSPQTSRKLVAESDTPDFAQSWLSRTIITFAVAGVSSVGRQTIENN